MGYTITKWVQADRDIGVEIELDCEDIENAITDGSWSEKGIEAIAYALYSSEQGELILEAAERFKR